VDRKVNAGTVVYWTMRWDRSQTVAVEFEFRVLETVAWELPVADGKLYFGTVAH
jgi:hypothetical protein